MQRAEWNAPQSKRRPERNKLPSRRFPAAGESLAGRGEQVGRCRVCAPAVFVFGIGRARVFEVTIVAGITVKDQTNNKVIFDNQNYIFKTEYEVTGDPNNFFNEEGTAVSRLARDFAKSVLTTILEGF